MSSIVLFFFQVQPSHLLFIFRTYLTVVDWDIEEAVNDA